MPSIRNLYITTVWLATIFSAVSMLHRYEVTAAPKLPPPHIPQYTRKNTILLMAHPQCPCTAAVLQNLEAIHLAYPDVQVEICLVVPGSAPNDFSSGPTSKWQVKHRWAKISIDHRGVLARSLGAAASGHIFFFDSNGEEKFSGGITRARGVAGDSTSSRELMAALAGFSPYGLTQHDVFGCSLL